MINDQPSDELAPELDDLTFNMLFGIPPDSAVVFADYLDQIANNGLLPLKTLIQYSETTTGKAGESLYTHVLDGIFVLEQLRKLLDLSDVEGRVLFTAYTIHDINKLAEGNASLRHLINDTDVTKQIRIYKLDSFFPAYASYLEDIKLLIQSHPGHSIVNVAATVDQRIRYGLRREQLNRLIALIQAADTLDLSQTLSEQKHKDNGLERINRATTTQYTLVTHTIAEQRGAFTNLLHNAVMEEFEAFGLIPLMLYPEGVAYLGPKGRLPAIDTTILDAVGKRAVDSFNAMVSAEFEQFIRPINTGITVDAKCLELGLPFSRLLERIWSIILKRQPKADKLSELASDAERRTRAELSKAAAKPSKTQRSLLDNPEPIDAAALLDAIEDRLAQGAVPQTAEKYRRGELIRTYYIFLLEHLQERVSQPWQHIYTLLGLAPERWPIYEAFDKRMDRAYVIATELSMADDEIYQRIEQDGTSLLGQQSTVDPRLPVLTAYLRQVLIWSAETRLPASFADALPHYVRQQRRQCVQCSLPFPTEAWMSADVRSDIKVQLFSNRLAGGPGEPKKRVCPICQMQFLVDKLNYRAQRNESTIYLHLFPYSFMPATMLQSLHTTIKKITQTDLLGGALYLQGIEDQVIQLSQDRPQRLSFRSRTRENKVQSVGIYVPQFTETLGSVLTFPLNPVGENDTQRFLFTLLYAVMLQRHFGCKVLVSTSVTPPLAKTAFGDLYLDLTPLSARGLIRDNDYLIYAAGKTPGNLRRLWQQLGMLLSIRHEVSTRQSDDWSVLVEAMADHPLRVFYVAEKLAEAKARTEKRLELGWIMTKIAEPTRQLALSLGDADMEQLDPHLRRLAQLARREHLIGSSFKKSSMLTALDTAFALLGQAGYELDLPVLQAAAAQDLCDHLERLRRMNGFSGSAKLAAGCRAFMEIMFEDVLGKVYSGKLARLLSHEKILRSAYHFYLREEYQRKPASSEELALLDPDSLSPVTA